MDSNASSFFINPSALQSVYYQGKEEDDSFIDLGLSLRALQPQVFHPSEHLTGQEGYDEFMEPWNHQENRHHPSRKDSSSGFQGNNAQQESEEDDGDGVQSKECWAYVKVNMDGVVVGRKLCILDHAGFSSLALQLEDMFGKQTASGLRLFQPGSEFCLFYKDREDNWRTVGDVPWKEFKECVKRIRIAQRK